MKTIFDNGTHTIQIPDGATTTAPPITKITTRAFMKRIPQASRIAIRNSVDDIVLDLNEDLKLASFVDLNDADVAAGLGYLVAQGILTQAEADACLVDGTASEAV